MTINFIIHLIHKIVLCFYQIILEDQVKFLLMENIATSINIKLIKTLKFNKKIFPLMIMIKVQVLVLSKILVKKEIKTFLQVLDFFIFKYLVSLKKTSINDLFAF